MQFKDYAHPTEDELQQWAYDPETDNPVQDWELILSWGMDRGRLRQLIQFAADPSCPHATFFLGVLFQWVIVVAKSQHYEIIRGHYDSWLHEAKGVKDPRVKQWRRKARLLFQGQQQFNYDTWVSEWSVVAQS